MRRRRTRRRKGRGGRGEEEGREEEEGGGGVVPEDIHGYHEAKHLTLLMIGTAQARITL